MLVRTRETYVCQHKHSPNEAVFNLVWVIIFALHNFLHCYPVPVKMDIFDIPLAVHDYD